MSVSFKRGLYGSLLAAAASSACCVLPWLLLLLGLNGAWVVHLTALAPYRPVLLLTVCVCLAAAGRSLYRPRSACSIRSLCGDARTLRRRRFAFWGVCLVSLIVAAAPGAADF